MIYLLSFLFALPSGILWFFNAEVFVVSQVSTTDAVPWLVAACVTAGQFVGYAALYLFSDRFLARLGVVQRSVARVQRRWPRVVPRDATPPVRALAAPPPPRPESPHGSGRGRSPQPRQTACEADHLALRRAESPDRYDPKSPHGSGRGRSPQPRPIGWGSYLAFTTGGLMGIPPLLALFALYGSARLGRLHLLLAFAVPARLTWYLMWAYAPDAIRDFKLFG